MLPYFKFRLPVLNKLVPACKLFRAFSKENACMSLQAGTESCYCHKQQLLQHTPRSQLERSISKEMRGLHL